MTDQAVVLSLARVIKLGPVSMTVTASRQLAEWIMKSAVVRPASATAAMVWQEGYAAGRATILDSGRPGPGNPYGTPSVDTMAQPVLPSGPPQERNTPVQSEESPDLLAALQRSLTSARAARQAQAAE